MYVVNCSRGCTYVVSCVYCFLSLAPADPPIVGDVVSSTHSVEYHWTLGDDGHSVIMQVKISCHILYL